MDEPESQLSDDEKAQLCKRVALARRKKTKASDEVWATLLLFVLLIPMPSPGHIIVAYSAPTWPTLLRRRWPARRGVGALNALGARGSS